MNADERLMSLKKAYADIILNTAKEAAARILVSERKALRFQHELFVAKEESLQMLLRLKRMMDSKTSEAEMASFSQQKKIEELELQLQEAEDIVKDLREELRGVQDELERAKKKEVSHLNHGSVTLQETSHSVIPPPSDLESAPISVPDLGNLDQGNEGQKIFSSFRRMGNSFVSNSDLPSIILRSKEPELYRNGCTQRVRACERTPLDGGSSFSDKVNDAKHDSTIKEEEGSEKVCKIHVREPDNKCNPEKDVVVQEDGMVSSWQQVRAVKSIFKKRKRSTRFTKSRDLSCRYQPDQVNKVNEAHGLDLVRDGYASTRQDITECTERSETPTDRRSIRKVDFPLITSESKSNTPDTTRVIPLHPVNDRVIKYTFQRKRKRETLNSSEGNTRENLNSDEGSASVGKKEDGSLEPEKCNLIEESSRDRRLLQVTHQLVSI